MGKCTGKCMGQCMAREVYLLANTKMKTQGHNSCQNYFEKCMRLMHMYLHSTLCMSSYACLKQCSTVMHFCMKHIHLCTAHIHLCTYMPKHYVSTLRIMSMHKIYLRYKFMSIEHKWLITKHKCSTSIHNVAVPYIFSLLLNVIL